ncbi:hypothetical protein [Streptomyces sp. NPDC017520]|uniref:hypothetical protein n=1 Tax=Streptomyces sp. NPDC017520 TaxID=3364998 RepID=UPI0037AD2D9E
MRWSFKLHGCAAAALSVAALVLAALTWLPGALPLFEPVWPMVAVFCLALLLLLAAVVRHFAAGADRSAMWLAFRCLPGRVQAGLGFLALAGAVVVGLDAAGDRRLQDAEVREGRYVAYDTSVTTDRAVELTRDEYLALLPSSRRWVFAIAGLMAAGAAAGVLTVGELRRADSASLTRVP